MFDRRGFLKTTFGLATGVGSGQVPFPGQSERTSIPRSTPEQEAYREIMARTSGMHWLGLPRDWSRVEQYLHPFTPERVIVQAGGCQLATSWCSCEMRDRIRQKVRAERWPEDNPGLGMTAEKFNILGTIIDRMTSYYDRPDLCEKWVLSLARREKLASSGHGHGVGLAHQFQNSVTETVSTDNALVDWWVFLFPAGIDFDGLDGQSVYAVFGHVFDRPRDGFQLGVWSLENRLAFRVAKQTPPQNGISEGGWEMVANMDRLTAATFLNYQLAHCLKDELRYDLNIIGKQEKR